MELTTVKLWRCPECGFVNQTIEGFDHAPKCSDYLSMDSEEITLVRLDQVIEMVEQVAAKERELDLNAKGAEYATYHYTYQRLESLAAQLKEANQ